MYVRLSLMFSIHGQSDGVSLCSKLKLSQFLYRGSVWFQWGVSSEGGTHIGQTKYVTEGSMGSFLVPYLVSAEKYFPLGLIYYPVLYWSYFVDLSNFLVSPVSDKAILYDGILQLAVQNGIHIGIYDYAQTSTKVTFYQGCTQNGMWHC